MRQPNFAAITKYPGCRTHD